MRNFYEASMVQQPVAPEVHQCSNGANLRLFDAHGHQEKVFSNNLAELSCAEEEFDARYQKLTQERQGKHVLQGSTPMCQPSQVWTNKSRRRSCKAHNQSTFTTPSRSLLLPPCATAAVLSRTMYPTISWTGFGLGSSALTIQSRTPSTTLRFPSSLLRTTWREASNFERRRRRKRKMYHVVGAKACESLAAECNSFELKNHFCVGAAASATRGTLSLSNMALVASFLLPVPANLRLRTLQNEDVLWARSGNHPSAILCVLFHRSHWKCAWQSFNSSARARSFPRHISFRVTPKKKKSVA